MILELVHDHQGRNRELDSQIVDQLGRGDVRIQPLPQEIGGGEELRSEGTIALLVLCLTRRDDPERIDAACAMDEHLTDCSRQSKCAHFVVLLPLAETEGHSGIPAAGRDGIGKAACFDFEDGERPTAEARLQILEVAEHPVTGAQVITKLSRHLIALNPRWQTGFRCQTYGAKAIDGSGSRSDLCMRPTQGFDLIEKELRIGGLEKLPLESTFHPRQTSQNLVTLRQDSGLLRVDRKRIEAKAGSGLAEGALLLVDLSDSCPLLRQLRYQT